jgi:branched-chain amino acid transport system ATP-binding protein/branched-chain amino acid transport system permease protein
VKKHAWLLAYVAVVALPAVLLADSYLLSIFVTVAFYGIVVISLDLLLGYGGLPTFGHTGFFALGTFVMGVLAARFRVPLALAILAALAANLALAAVIGFATLRLREYYFAVATLGFAVIVIQVIGGLPELTGGWSGLTGMPQPSVLGVPLRSDLQFYVLGAIGVLLSLLGGRNLVASRFGRAVRAIAADQLGAETLGIPSARHKVQLFMVSATMASLAGSFYGLYLRVPTPANFDVPVMVDMVLMLFLGGRETLWGGLLGATVVRLLPEALGRFQDYRVMLQGAIFILILIFFPRGLAGVVTTLVRRRGVAVVEPIVSVKPLVSRAQVLGAEPLLVAEGLNKRFGGLRAVSDLDLTVRPHQIKAIIGPNGAGKTTAFNLLTRTLPLDSGRVIFRGTDLSPLRPHQVAGLGLLRTFQTPRLFGSMSVLENVMVGHFTQVPGSLAEAIVPMPAAQRKEEQVRASSLALLEMVGMARRAEMPATSLPFGERRLLEIVRALAAQPLLLLLDEPAAGLNESEKDQLALLLLRLRAEGLTLLLVEHDVGLVMRLADEVLVMDQGATIAEGRPNAIQRDESVMRAYLGTEAPVAAG